MSDTHPESWTGWMFRPLRRYADFRGRSGRREFWWYSLFLALGYAVITALGITLALANAAEDNIGVFIAAGWGVFFLANFVPGIALTTRRLHDLGLPGALLIAIFVVLLVTSLLGWIAYLVVMSLPGQAKTNRWGPPLGAPDVAEVFG